ncbi:hypothetical protein ACPOL_1467 [Acidisarcina polymorpha]|uniref:Uncharacterized protein n=1 Tax=Acidisarcina polymorpha TaxID=2211140 RepID=A0A2Z5FV99_9BACT|nr:hypothetical protein [Acidisarcina polymorpha]AXC10813.1 hypothetical protein ACPOL_1467 [Acidisarcina polymorpha]
MPEVGNSANSVVVPVKRGFFPLSVRTKSLLIAAIAVSLLVILLLVFQRQAPPEAARLLPESDGIVYLNVTPLRAATHFDAHPVKHDPDYQQFIDATGIQFERDLAQAAFAMHRMANPLGPNGPVAFSSIFVGHFDRLRLASYLERIAQSRETYDGHEIYDIAIDGRTDRVAILSSDIVAVSNTPTAEQIHSILDRHRTAFLPLSSNTLLAQHYKDVPLFSLAWGLGKLAAGLGDDFNVFGFRLPLSVDATFIASLRWAGALRLKVEEIAPNGAAATVSANSLEALLGIFKTAENVLPNAVTSTETKDLLNSVEIEHHDDRAVLTATIPLRFLQTLSSVSGSDSTP